MILEAQLDPAGASSCGCRGELMLSWPFSARENGTAVILPLHFNRKKCSKIVPL
jgi:hypothetical protein